MSEQRSIFYRICFWALKKIGMVKERNNEEGKLEMCRRAVSSGVCPMDCARCAWCVMNE
ncbi:MAG: hypothetical protein ACI4WY_07315 [Anaerovoracaceae bacterium]